MYSAPEEYQASISDDVLVMHQSILQWEDICVGTSTNAHNYNTLILQLYPFHSKILHLQRRFKKRKFNSFPIASEVCLFVFFVSPGLSPKKQG